MKLLEIAFQPLQDFNAVGHARLIDINFLETARQCTVFFKMLAKLLIGRRAHAPQATALQSRFQQVRGVHRTPGGCPRPDDGMNLVDKQNRFRHVFQFGHNLFEAFLEITAIACTGQQHTHIQRVNNIVAQNIRHIALDNFTRQTFSNSRFANAGVTHQKRVVFIAAAQNLYRAIDLIAAPDKRVHASVAGFFIEVDAIGGQRFAGGNRVGVIIQHIFANNRSAFAMTRLFGNPVRDEIHRIITGHLLFLQEVSCMAFALGEHGHQHICPRHLIAAGRLHMNHRTLDNPLEPCRGLAILGFVHNQAGQLIVDIIGQIAPQLFQIDAARFHNSDSFGVFRQGEQQMFQRGIFMVALIGEHKRPMQTLF